MEKEILQKETAILDAVMSLVNQGIPPHLIKVADVAQAAGIGKSTVYEYFASKEELLIRAFSHAIGKMMETFLCEFEKALDFREGMMNVFALLAEWDRRSFSLFHFCDTEMSALTHHRLFDQIYRSYFDTFLACMDRIVARGANEGVFPLPDDAAYGRFALIAAFSGFHTALSARIMAGDPHAAADDLLIYAYENLRRSLRERENAVELHQKG